ncbi:MAG: SGNH/GDSL hydrolase family protein [Betaproteobacteria bacterium]|nr:SGNH/GDSL hydrolase family protein [Betaproteobacteria bacterium]
MARNEGGRWVGTWTTTLAPIEGIALENQTIRMIARVSIGGCRLRVRLSNAYGTRKLSIGAARVALRAEGAGIVPDSDRRLTFNGEPSTTIAAGSLVVSDPMDLELAPLSDLVVSVHLSGSVPQDFQLTGHGNARQTNYVSPPGDHTASLVMPVQRSIGDWLFVSGVEVLAPANTGGIVAFGDSLTECNISTVDANRRWPDQLARRIVARGGRMLGVMNQGIGGARLLHDIRGESGLRRFDRDVLAQTGVTHVIVLIGINDIRNRWQKPDEFVSAEEIISGLNQLAVRSHARGLKIFGGTVLTFEYETFNPGFYTPEGEEKRQKVNAWIRGSGAFDAIIDFETALREPGHPTRMLPAYDCGDHLHPSDAGYLRMGDIIDLSLFD